MFAYGCLPRSDCLLRCIIRSRRSRLLVAEFTCSGFSIEVTACADLRAFLSSARRRRSTTFGLCFEMTRMEEILETPETLEILESLEILEFLETFETFEIFESDT